MTKVVFEEHLANIEADANVESCTTRLMGELLDEIITAGQDWADDVFLNVLRGTYGAHVRRVALLTVENGFQESGAICSFTRFCVQYKKIELLTAVADLGLPQDRIEAGARYVRATTSGGRWIDILANLNHQGPDTSFARQVFAFATSEVAAQLADILVKHDPKHQDIEMFKDSHGYAVVVDALMRRHITTLGSVAPVAPKVQSSARSRRAGL